MASIKEAERLLKEVYISNLTAKEGKNITLLLSGRHGLGKTQVITAAARGMGGAVVVADGSTLMEGEMTGLPIAHKEENGVEVQFVPHYTIAAIQRMEKAYYEKAISTGFCNGKYKLTEKGIVVKDGKTEEIIEDTTTAERILSGEINKYKFGANLSGKQKLELVESGEIAPVFLFFDEINRTEQQTMKQLMNIILNKNVNGYDIPWFVSIVAAINPSSQNSAYSTNEMDPAQLDRFLKIKIEPRLEAFIEYGLSKKLNTEVLSAIASNEGIFVNKDDSLVDNDPSSPSPRSWEMVAHLFDTVEDWKASKFLTEEEKSEKNITMDLGVLVSGKVGAESAAVLFEAMKDKESQIKPEEIVNGNSDKLDAKIVEKFKSGKIKQLKRKIIAETLISYLCNNYYSKFEKDSKTPEGKKKFTNAKAQLKEFITNPEILDSTTRLLFAKSSMDRENKCEDGKFLFEKIAVLFSAQLLKELGDFKRDLESI